MAAKRKLTAEVQSTEGGLHPAKWHAVFWLTDGTSEWYWRVQQDDWTQRNVKRRVFALAKLLGIDIVRYNGRKVYDDGSPE